MSNTIILQYFCVLAHFFYPFIAYGWTKKGASSCNFKHTSPVDMSPFPLIRQSLMVLSFSIIHCFFSFDVNLSLLSFTFYDFSIWYFLSSKSDHGYWLSFVVFFVSLTYGQLLVLCEVVYLILLFFFCNVSWDNVPCHILSGTYVWFCIIGILSLMVKSNCWIHNKDMQQCSQDWNLSHCFLCS